MYTVKEQTKKEQLKEEQTHLVSTLFDLLEEDKTIYKKYPTLDNAILTLMESTLSVKKEDKNHITLMQEVLGTIKKSKTFLEEKTDLVECIVNLNDSVLEAWDLSESPSPLKFPISPFSKSFGKELEIDSLNQDIVKVWSPPYFPNSFLSPDRSIFPTTPESPDQGGELSKMVENYDWDCVNLKLLYKSSSNFFSEKVSQKNQKKDEGLEQKTNRKLAF